jgi:single-strand DNA-binding protein
MNNVILSGRLTADPEIRYTQAGTPVANYILAVDRYSKDEKKADFIRCVAWGKRAEFAEKYMQKGRKFIISGAIQTDSYEKDGRKVYTTDIIVSSQEFADSKPEGQSAQPESTQHETASDEFMDVPENLAEELPFN